MRLTFLVFCLELEVEGSGRWFGPHFEVCSELSNRYTSETMVCWEKSGAEVAQIWRTAINSSHSDVLGAALQQMLGFDCIEAVEMQTDV